MILPQRLRRPCTDCNNRRLPDLCRPFAWATTTCAASSPRRTSPLQRDRPPWTLDSQHRPHPSSLPCPDAATSQNRSNDVSAQRAPRRAKLPWPSCKRCPRRPPAHSFRCSSSKSPRYARRSRPTDHLPLHLRTLADAPPLRRLGHLLILTPRLGSTSPCNIATFLSAPGRTGRRLCGSLTSSRRAPTARSAPCAIRTFYYAAGPLAAARRCARQIHRLGAAASSSTLRHPPPSTVSYLRSDAVTPVRRAPARPHVGPAPRPRPGPAPTARARGARASLRYHGQPRPRTAPGATRQTAPPTRSSRPRPPRATL
jgi:hypothetical protein